MLQQDTVQGSGKQPGIRPLWKVNIAGKQRSWDVPTDPREVKRMRKVRTGKGQPAGSASAVSQSCTVHASLALVDMPVARVRCCRLECGVPAGIRPQCWGCTLKTAHG